MNYSWVFFNLWKLKDNKTLVGTTSQTISFHCSIQTIYVVQIRILKSKTSSPLLNCWFKIYVNIFTIHPPPPPFHLSKKNTPVISSLPWVHIDICFIIIYLYFSSARNPLIKEKEKEAFVHYSFSINLVIFYFINQWPCDVLFYWHFCWILKLCFSFYNKLEGEN